MLTLIINAEVYSPEPLGSRQLLVAGGRIAALERTVDVRGDMIELVDAQGLWLLPGFIDALTHPCGGGGEGGFGNRTAEVPAAEFIQAGVTSPVGALGTDSLTRSLEVLYGKVMSLRAGGLDPYMYTGAYRVPPPTLTGDVARDITLIDPVIGVGEVAISDHRSSQPSAAELRRIAADARLGGTLSGRGGSVMVHVGAGSARLAPLRQALEGSDLPPSSFYPTHANRDANLLGEMVDYAKAGGFIDITVSTTPELIAAGDIPALQALCDAIAAGAPRHNITLSSDAGGSLPLYEAGQLRGLTAASPGSLLALLRETVRDAPEHLVDVLASLTCNPAAALNLPGKGRLAIGAAADLLLFDPASGELRDVMCGGRWLWRNAASSA